MLYLSEYFLNNRQAYYDALNTYRKEESDISNWLDFFLDGVAIIAEEAIGVSKKINLLRQENIIKMQSLGRRSITGTTVLEKLYKLPIITVKNIEDWTNLSTPQANELVQKLVEVGILQQRNQYIKYNREFWYKEYIKLFTHEN